MPYTKSFDNAKIYYKIFNKDSRKQTLFFIHGLACNWTTWKGEINILRRKGYRIIAMDLRGHGKSQNFNERDRFKIEFLAHDVNEILKKEKIRTKIVLIGHSLGGMTSLQFYKMFPDKVKKIILTNSFYKDPLDVIDLGGVEKHIIPKIRELLSKINLKKIIELSDEEKDFSKYVSKNDLIILINCLQTTPLNTLVFCLDELQKFDMSPILYMINIPVLIIGGTKDIVFPENVEKKMRNKIKKSDIILLEGTHSLPIKDPENVAKSIEEFVKK